MTPQTRHFILGAAGHVDHGKTALITALTGTNTDRLKEEQERGISIELGFAELDLGGGLHLGVVDMPGHERFVKQMVSGAGGVDLALLVIAADEGVMPQTIEHLEILDALGVRGGVIVLSKTDLVDEDILAVAAEEAREVVAGTFLEGKPLVAVSATRGKGLDGLLAALRDQAGSLGERPAEGLFRMPLDRVFTMPGVGVVVTGTCWSGQVAEGDRLLVQPVGLPVRVREIQVHGQRAALGRSGQRLALALHGAKRDDLQRGFQLAAEKAAQVTRRLDLRLNLMPHYQGSVKNRQRLHVHHAGREVLGRVVLLDEKELGGDRGPRTALAQLHLEDELVAARGDRLVLRFYSPVTSLAGGIVLDPQPRRHKRFAETVLGNLEVMETGDSDELFAQQLESAGLAGIPLAEAAEDSEHPEARIAGKRVYHRQLLAGLTATIAELLAEYGQRYPLRLGLPKEETRRRCKFKGGPAEWNAICQTLAQDGSWVVVGDRIAASLEGPPLAEPLQAAVEQVRQELQALGLQWPGLRAFAENSPTFTAAAGRPELKDCEPAEVMRHLVDHGQAVAVASDFLVATGALADLRDRLREHFRARPELTFAEFRELSGLSRKLGIPLLEYLDREELTVRQKDIRLAGPRLEAALEREGEPG